MLRVVSSVSFREERGLGLWGRGWGNAVIGEIKNSCVSVSDIIVYFVYIPGLQLFRTKDFVS